MRHLALLPCQCPGARLFMTGDEALAQAIRTCAELVAAGQADEALSGLWQLDLVGASEEVVHRFEAVRSDAFQVAANARGVDTKTLAAALVKRDVDRWIERASRDPVAGLEGLDRFSFPPGVIEIRSTAGGVAYNRAALRRQLGLFDEAEAGYRQTVDDFARDPDPEVSYWGAVALFNHATMLLDLPESTTATAEEALDLLERLLTDFGESSHPSIRNRVARGARISIETMIELGRTADAAERYDRFRPMYAQDDPEGPNAWGELERHVVISGAGPLPEEVLVRAVSQDFADSFAVLRAIGSSPSESAERYRLLFERPLLLTERAARLLGESPDAAVPDERESIRAGLAFANTVRQQMEAAGRGYPLTGGSVLEQLINSINVLVAEDAALEIARRPLTVSALSFPYVVAIWQWAVMLAEQGEWRKALRIQRVLLAATDRLPLVDQNASMRHRAAIGYLNIARVALTEVPDPRVLRSAVDIGNRILAEAGDDVNLAVEALAGLGGLYAEPYGVGRHAETYWSGLRRWMDRLREEVPDPTVDLSAPEWQMPDVQDALDTAEGYLQRALALAEGKPTTRGHILVSLLGVAATRVLVGLDIDRDSYRAMSIDAVESLDPWRQAQLYASALSHLAKAGEEVAPASLNRIIAEPIENLVSEIGERAVMQTLIAIAEVFRQSNADRVLALFDAARSLIDRTDEELRLQVWLSEWGLLGVQRRRVPESVMRSGKLDEVSSWLAHHARDERWEQDDIDRVLLGVQATKSVECDNDEAETNGMAVWEEVTRRLARNRPWLASYVNATASTDVATRAFQREDWQAGALWGLRACGGFVEVNALDAAAECLTLIGHACQQSGRGEIARPVLAALLPMAVALEDRLGSSGRATLQRIYRTLISNVLGGPNIDIEALLAALQLAKGLRMTASLQANRSYDVAADPRGRELLDRIEAMEADVAQAGGQGSRHWATTDYQQQLLDDLTLVTEYEEDLETGAGSNARSLLENLQRSFDAHVTSHLLGALDETPSWILAAELQSLLDPDAVLMLLHVGARFHGQTVLLTLVVTAGELHICLQPLEMDQGLGVSIGGRQRRMDWIQGTVCNFRIDIVDDPGPGQLSSSARKGVQSLAAELLGPAMDLLRTQHSEGKRRLIIIPHGAMHFMPFHLLHIDGVPMAEMFAVTYLPNLAFLRRPAARDTPDGKRRPIASIGLGFETFPNPDELPAIPGATREAARIAAIFGAEPVLDASATRTAVVDGLRSSERVHIATHGAHNVAAPSFQRLFLAPETGDYDWLAAYELLRLDLHGLDLVTLSACETALGRFDPSDNVRGIPASLLLRGAAAVIGTMWPVETGVSQAFFNRLYQNLHAGMSRVDAFAQAQRHVRQDHPQYRDWGAFMYLGT